MAFTVKTNHGWGWRVPEESQCPSFGTQAEATRYAELRNQGYSHVQAWGVVQIEKEQRRK